MAHLSFSVLRFVVFIMISLNLNAQQAKQKSITIGAGQMPSVVQDKQRNLHVVFGRGDSLLYAFSTNQGTSYSTPILVKMVPELAAGSMRGPQIAATPDGVVVIAANAQGDIFSFTKTQPQAWVEGTRVNDVDTIAKENLIALSSDGNTTYAVWLDLRENRRNKIYGASSTNNGKSWSKNKLIYASPDGTVCECCKPSVAVRGKDVYVMFRNWINGNRDLYLIHSADGGKTFGTAEKLGIDSWKLDGCPMDGGGLTVGKGNQVQTVWRRKDKIYSCTPGEPEQLVGQGKNCTMTTVNGKSVYAWVENGEVTIVRPNGNKQILGGGMMPVLSVLNNHAVVCVWENDRQVHSAIIDM